jgi:hypothetical protein
VLDVCPLCVWAFSSLIMVYETPALRTEGGNPLLIGRRGRVGPLGRTEAFAEL